MIYEIFFTTFSIMSDNCLVWEQFQIQTQLPLELIVLKGTPNSPAPIFDVIDVDTYL